MAGLHALVRRQLRLHPLTSDDGHHDAFVAAVDAAYRAFDDDRRMLERSLELSSQELLHANAQMRAMFAALPDSFVLVDGQGIISSFRGSPLRHGRIDPAHAVGTNVRDLFGSHGAMMEEAIGRVLRDRLPESLELVSIVGGQSATHEARVMPVVEDRALVILRDVTAQRRAGDALRRSELRFRALVENATDLVAIVDADGTLRYVGNSVSRIMGYPPEDWMGTNLLSFVHREDIGIVAHSLAAALTRPGIHAPVQARLRRRNGEWLLLECSANNLLHDENIEGVVINARSLDLVPRPMTAMAAVHAA